MENSRAFVVDTSHSPYAKLRPIPVDAVRLEDSFWAPRLRLLREVTLPTQYQLLEETGRLFNFRRAAGTEAGDFRGLYFNDSDVYKWVEAVAFSLAYASDKGMHDLAQMVINDIISAQDNDGYLDTYFTFERKKDRWTNEMQMHELYCSGHLMQAAIAYYRATGERSLLDAACRSADHIATVFGPDKRAGTPGHPEVEMAFVELYRTVGNPTYLELARFFIDNRGKGLIGGGVNHIDHKPFRELTEIVGHAVRSLYLNSGASDIYMETGEQALWDALTRLWQSLTERRMYITAGAGSRYQGEAFGDDYELSNARAYAETCAAIANAMWNWRMLLVTGEARYADVMELATYNGALSGISLGGKEYFYVNPLADRGRHRRQEWFNCACCPPNIARLLASLPGYLYSLSSEGIWIHLYAQSTTSIDIGGKTVTVKQRTNYPWDGEVEVALELDGEETFSLYLRVPGWSREAKVQVNGRVLETHIQPCRYVEVHRSWKAGDRVHLRLAMPVERMVSHPFVAENTDRVALKRGPLVYCVEQADNSDFDVWNLVLSSGAPLKSEWMPQLLNGVMAIKGEASAIETEDFGGLLYRPLTKVSFKTRPVRFTAIPYYAWANRQPGRMTVWIRLDKQATKN